MEKFEDLACTQDDTSTKDLYVDNTFCVMEKEHTQTFLNHLNSLRPTIQLVHHGAGERWESPLP